MKLVYRKAETADASLLIEIYNSAFYHDYIYYGECPAYGRTIERMEYSIEKYPKYIIYADLKPVGAISFKNNGNGIYYLGCLCIIDRKSTRLNSSHQIISYAVFCLK